MPQGAASLRVGKSDFGGRRLGHAFLDLSEVVAGGPILGKTNRGGYEYSKLQLIATLRSAASRSFCDDWKAKDLEQP